MYLIHCKKGKNTNTTLINIIIKEVTFAHFKKLVQKKKRKNAILNNFVEFIK